MPRKIHGPAIALGLSMMLLAFHASAQEADGGVSAEDAGIATPVSDDRIDELDQQVRITQRKLELDEEKRAEDKKTASKVSAGEEGFSLSSADGNYKVKLKALLQLDGRAYPGDGRLPLTDTFLVRRARPILDVTLFGFVDGRIMPDFGDGKVQLYDAYAELKPRTWFKLRLGKFKPPVGLERLQSAANTFFNERAFPTGLVPTRDIGAQVSSELWNGAITVTVGVFNGVADGALGDNDTNESKDTAARIFVKPFKPTAIDALENLGLGIAGSVGRQNGSTTASNLNSYKSPGQQTIFNWSTDTFADGMRQRLAPQASFTNGPVGFIGEYTLSQNTVNKGGSKAKLTHRAWQGAVAFVFTGEDATTEGVVPKHPLNVEQGDWGAVEAVGRYEEIRFDPASFPLYADPSKSVGRARSGGAGINWYLSRNLRVGFDLDRTWFEHGAAAGADRPPESSLSGRLQASF